ncbi:sodium:alanine symporter [Bacillus coahuilensis p1.1.43]|uniref:Sodium:alanine symporter n=1 Tax=Bacillus coahuilensis p1.1.43 TaxID=1150625 RepID=A0A147KCG1_9BACI|nr:alanine/glycine:cation symporter family protein [Bacillus coahuilensis]KUP09265.1 sodium:alanine symporter [Bacillus coahuilensis p1.1.43]
MKWLNDMIGSINTLLWSNVLIVVLIGLGLYFTFRSGFVQIRLIKEMVKLLGEGTKSKNGGISSFQAFCISTASRVGTGNLAGVALAITAGGPGAVFWMWLIALLGAASSFVESTLAQIYKVRDGETFRGGPAYYMEKALNARWMGITFAVIITLTFGLAFNSVQANTIASAFNAQFGISKGLMAVILSVITAVIIFGGIKRIAVVSQVIVPVMAGIYIILALIIMMINVTEIPSVFVLIFESAFGLREAASGALGAAMMNGIKRGLFSNEAGMGSAPNAAATADVSHPVKQGLIQTLGVFVDTLIICSSTAFIILLSGVYTNKGEDNGIVLTQTALDSTLGSWAAVFLSVIVLLFAFSSIVGNYYYGESNIGFIHQNVAWIHIYRVAVVAMVAFGSVASLSFVWNLADMLMGIMALINSIAIILLGKIAFAALKDYQDQKAAGKDPVFYSTSIKGLKNVEAWEPERDTSHL